MRPSGEPSAGAPVVEIAGLTRRFGPKVALDAVDVCVPAGGVFGLVGENGAGKTTLIKHVLGLLRAQSGSVRVFGKDPTREPEAVLARIGYLSEEADLPTWMRVKELMRYTEAFYPTWDRGYAEELRAEFMLDANVRLKTLSKGQRARAGLIAALAFRPDLLLLDEPSSGLDPIVRRDILGAIVRTIADEGRTVLFSSHLLSEVERVSDYVAMIREGRVVFCDTLDAVKQGHFRMTLHFPDARPKPPSLEGALAWEGGGQEWSAICAGRSVHLEAEATLLGARVVEESAVSLDEIFVARTGAPTGDGR
jgi:ABC-2 type transport system ATP-binding protein